MPHDNTPPDLPELYTLDSIEQVRAVADELRIRIIDLLIQQPMTVTQIGEALGIAPAKAHYHVGELKRVGLVRIVKTRERGNIVEKYYRTVARDFTISDTLLQHVAPDETLAAISQHLQTLTRAFLRAFSRAIGSEDQRAHYIQLTSASLWATHDEMRHLNRRITELLEPYHTPRRDANVHPRMLAIIGYDIAEDASRDSSGPDAAASAGAPAEQATVPPVHARALEAQPLAGAPTPRRVVVAGVVFYRRDELEQIVARGEALDMHIIGLCTFADDIPANLAERAIVRFRLRGVLSASHAVRAVLKHKEPRKERPHTPTE
jgi:DNA-binding transcriptional ArsR family regulator